MMIVQVSTVSNHATTSKFELRVNATDTVASTKEKITVAAMLAFPGTLMLGDTKLEEGNTLAACGVKEHACLNFVIDASEESIVKQLTELLRARDLTVDELALLYCYKHGVSINQALKTVGAQDMKLQDFVKTQKTLALEGSKISLVRNDTALQPFSVAKQLEQLLRENGPSMDITALCSKFVQKFHVSVANVVQMRPAEFLEKEDAFVLLGDGMVTLKGYEKVEKAKASRSRSPSSRGVRSPAPGLEKPSRARSVEKSRLAQTRSRPQSISRDDSMYQDLHTKISSRSFNSRVSQCLTTISDLVVERSFLNISEVVKGGSVAKGTAITGGNDAELVFFVKGLPSEGHSKWMPSLLKSVKSVLETNLPAGQASDIHCTEDSVSMVVKNTLQLHLRFSPAFDTYTDAVQALGRSGPNARKMFEPSFVKERTEFVAKQPGSVKVTARLLRWWRDQQVWSCELTTPQDYLLELIAIYITQQCGKVDQAQMIANAMSLMARFNQLRVVWSNFYNKEDIWAPLIMQKPLLMDPVNPFVNIADPQDFDPRELMKFAAETRFFF